jgi:histone H3/H4
MLLCEEVKGSQGKKRKAADADMPPASLPISSVKRIMCLDADVKRVSGDAVTLVAQVAKLFLEHLAGKSMEVARKVCSHRNTRAPTLSERGTEEGGRENVEICPHV